MNAFISALPGVFEAIEGSAEVREAFIFAAWRQIAGAQVAERTSPMAVEERRLVIAVADKAWKLNLESLASQLLFKLNGSLGKSLVDYMEFRIAPDVIDRAEQDPGTPDPEPAPTPVELSVSAQKIRDENLRATVLRAAANCLARQS